MYGETRKVEGVSGHVLEAVRELRVGRGTLALVLKGSKSELVAHFRKTNAYGRLFWYTVPAIKGFISQLTMKKLIRVIDAGAEQPRPVLVLTAQGVKAIKGPDIPLEVLKEPPREIELTDTLKATFEAFGEKYSVADTAARRGLALSTVYRHLEQLIALGVVDAGLVVDSYKQGLIREAFEQKGDKSLKELKSVLPEQISYEEIRCVLAGLKRKDE